MLEVRDVGNRLARIRGRSSPQRNASHLKGPRYRRTNEAKESEGAEAETEVEAEAEAEAEGVERDGTRTRTRTRDWGHKGGREGRVERRGVNNDCRFREVETSEAK